MRHLQVKDCKSCPFSQQGLCSHRLHFSKRDQFMSLPVCPTGVSVTPDWCPLHKDDVNISVAGSPDVSAWGSGIVSKLMAIEGVDEGAVEEILEAIYPLVPQTQLSPMRDKIDKLQGELDKFMNAHIELKIRLQSEINELRLELRATKDKK